MRQILLLGDLFLPSTPWLTASKLLAFWFCNTFIFAKYLGRFSTLGALCTLPVVTMNWWRGTTMDIGICFAMGCLGGWVDGRFLSVEEADELARVAVLEEFWKEVFSEIFLSTNSGQGGSDRP
jgi:hypothetical protein